MDETIQHSENPLQKDPASEASPIHEIRSHGHVIYYVAAIITLLLGLGIGYLIKDLFLKSSVQSTPVETTETSLSLPADAKKIEECSEHQGTLYVRPQDIPQGPIYMLHDGKVIGLEYMVPKELLLNNQNMDFLQGKDIKVDHVNIGAEPSGHAGYAIAHYHIDLYTIDKQTQMNISCPGGSSDSNMMMPGMEGWTCRFRFRFKFRFR